MTTAKELAPAEPAASQATTEVDLSRYNEREREIIDLMQRGEDRPLTQEQITNGLEQAKSDPWRRPARLETNRPRHEPWPYCKQTKPHPITPDRAPYIYRA